VRIVGFLLARKPQKRLSVSSQPLGRPGAWWNATGKGVFNDQDVGKGVANQESLPVAKARAGQLSQPASVINA
jgi:hypothetical protein